MVCAKADKQLRGYSSGLHLPTAPHLYTSNRLAYKGGNRREKKIDATGTPCGEGGDMKHLDAQLPGAVTEERCSLDDYNFLQLSMLTKKRGTAPKSG